MGRPPKEQKIQQEPTLLEKTLETAEKAVLPIDEMPLTSLREYRLYNEAASKANKKLKLCRYPLKPAPEELHPKERIIFGRNDQPSNPLPVFLSNSLIHYDETLVPGKEYMIPQCVVSYLSQKGTPIWQWFDKPDGSRETGISHKEPRFALRTVYAE